MVLDIQQGGVATQRCRDLAKEIGSARALCAFKTSYPSYVVSIVRYGIRHPLNIISLVVTPENRVTKPCQRKVIIIVSGTTLSTRQKTDYQILFGE